MGAACQQIHISLARHIEGVAVRACKRGVCGYQRSGTERADKHAVRPPCNEYNMKRISGLAAQVHGTCLMIYPLSLQPYHSEDTERVVGEGLNE
jgi:hypothetical protein